MFSNKKKRLLFNVLLLLWCVRLLAQTHTATNTCETQTNHFSHVWQLRRWHCCKQIHPRYSGISVQESSQLTERKEEWKERKRSKERQPILQKLQSSELSEIKRKAKTNSYRDVVGVVELLHSHVSANNFVLSKYCFLSVTRQVSPLARN